MEILVIIIIIFLVCKLKRKKRTKRNPRTGFAGNGFGYEFLATLDFKTCLVCGVLDRRRYKSNETVPEAIHEGCRCCIIPFTPVSDFSDEKRPAEQRPFMAMAEVRYNTKPGRRKRFQDLTEKTREKYYYQEIERYESETGKRAFVSVKYSFSEWFQRLPRKYQEFYLGRERYLIFKNNKLELKDLVDLKKLREYTLDELKQRYQ